MKLNQVSQTEKVITLTNSGRQRRKQTTMYQITNSQGELFGITDYRLFGMLTGKLMTCKAELFYKGETITRYYTSDRWEHVVDDFSHIIEGKESISIDPFSGKTTWK